MNLGWRSLSSCFDDERTKEASWLDTNIVCLNVTTTATYFLMWNLSFNSVLSKTA